MKDDNLKREKTLEELEKQLKETMNQQRELAEIIKKRKQEAEEERKANLAKEKEERKKEVDNALEHYFTLVKKYVKDYGSYQAANRDTFHCLFPELVNFFFD